MAVQEDAKTQKVGLFEPIFFSKRREGPSDYNGVKIF